MNEGIETLIKETKERADQKVRDIISKANKKAEEIIQSAINEAERKIKPILQREEKIFRRRIIDKAEVEGRHSVVKAKHEIFEKIRKKARQKLKSIVEGENPDYDYHEILYKLFKESVSQFNEDELYISANTRDRKYLKNHLKQIEQQLENDTQEISLVLTEEDFNCLGGVKVENKKGTKTFYSTLDGRLRNSFNQIKPKLNRILFTKKEEFGSE